MEERMEWYMVVPSFQTEFYFDAMSVPKMDDEWKRGEDKKKTKGQEVWAGSNDHGSYCS